MVIRTGSCWTNKVTKKPLNAYGASKRAVEDILRDFGVIHGLEAVVFRYFNVAGADIEAEIGEWHQPETHLIPAMIEAAAGAREALTIYGTDYPTPDGTCVRDYVHVMDLVTAHIQGLEWLLNGKGSRVFNLGTGTGFSVKEVIAECKFATGHDVPHSFGPRRVGDAAVLISGSRRAVEELGWTPERSTLQYMIADAWRWHRTRWLSLNSRFSHHHSPEALAVEFSVSNKTFRENSDESHPQSYFSMLPDSALASYLLPRPYRRSCCPSSINRSFDHGRDTHWPDFTPALTVDVVKMQ